MLATLLEMNEDAGWPSSMIRIDHQHHSLLMKFLHQQLLFINREINSDKIMENHDSFVGFSLPKNKEEEEDRQAKADRGNSICLKA